MPKKRQIIKVIGERPKIDIDKIPDSVISDLSVSLIADINRYFQQPGIKEEFDKWLEAREKKKRSKSQKTA